MFGFLKHNPHDYAEDVLDDTVKIMKQHAGVIPRIPYVLAVFRGTKLFTSVRDVLLIYHVFTDYFARDPKFRAVGLEVLRQLPVSIAKRTRTPLSTFGSAAHAFTHFTAMLATNRDMVPSPRFYAEWVVAYAATLPGFQFAVAQPDLDRLGGELFLLLDGNAYA